MAEEEVDLIQRQSSLCHVQDLVGRLPLGAKSMTSEQISQFTHKVSLRSLSVRGLVFGHFDTKKSDLVVPMLHSLKLCLRD